MKNRSSELSNCCSRHSICRLVLHIRGMQCRCLSGVINKILYYLAPFVTNGIFLDTILRDPSGTNTDL